MFGYDLICVLNVLEFLFRKLGKIKSELIYDTYTPLNDLGFRVGLQFDLH